MHPCHNDLQASLSILADFQHNLREWESGSKNCGDASTEVALNGALDALKALLMASPIANPDTPPPANIPFFRAGDLPDIPYTLKLARIAAGFTQAGMAQELGWATSEVTRAETPFQQSSEDFHSAETELAHSALTAWGTACGYTLLNVLFHREYGKISELLLETYSWSCWARHESFAGLRCLIFAEQLRAICAADSISFYVESFDSKTGQSNIEMMWHDGLRDLLWRNTESIVEPEIMAVLKRMHTTQVEYHQVAPHSDGDSYGISTQACRKSILHSQGISSFITVPLDVPGGRGVIFINYNRNQRKPPTRFLVSLEEIQRLPKCCPELFSTKAIPIDVALRRDESRPAEYSQIIGTAPHRMEARELMIKLRTVLDDSAVITLYRAKSASTGTELEPVTAFPRILPEEERNSNHFGLKCSIAKLAFNRWPYEVQICLTPLGERQEIENLEQGRHLIGPIRSVLAIDLKPPADPELTSLGVLTIESQQPNGFSVEQIGVARLVAWLLADYLASFERLEELDTLMEELQAGRQANGRKG